MPLPPKTAFAYRYASNGCVYYTEKQREEILKYFKNTEDDFSLFKEASTDDDTKFKLRHKGNSYWITIKTSGSGKGLFLHIENTQ
jgi:hypothetical protein